MTPAEMRNARKGVPLTQAELAKALGYSRMSIVSWEKGLYHIPDDVAAKVLEICIGVPVLQPKNARLTAETIKAYRKMRLEDFPHSMIVDLWRRKNFIPTPEARAAILAEFLNILDDLPTANPEK